LQSHYTTRATAEMHTKMVVDGVTTISVWRSGRQAMLRRRAEFPEAVRITTMRKPTTTLH